MTFFRSNQLGLYVKGRLFVWETLTTFMAIFGLFTLISRAVDFVFGTIEALHSTWTFFGFIFVSVLLTIWRRWPLTKIAHQLNETDTKLEIVVGDLFNYTGCTVIPTNTSFDTTLNEKLISIHSVQGKFQTKMYPGKETELADLIAEQLQNKQPCKERVSQVNGNTIQYPLGTTVHDDQKPTRYMLWAMADLNDMGIAQTNITGLKDALDALWSYFNAETTFADEINIPVCGTRYGRSNIPPMQTILLIVATFIAKAKKEKVTKKLRIVIYKEDFYESSIDLSKLDDILSVLCTSPLALQCLSGTENNDVNALN